MVLLVYFVLFFDITYTSVFGDIVHEIVHGNGDLKYVEPNQNDVAIEGGGIAPKNENVPKNAMIFINETINTGIVPKTSNEIKVAPTLIKIESAITTRSPIHIIPLPHDPDIQSGALMRGFYVFFGITLLLLLYIAIRMYRLRKGSKPPTMVKKYGVLTNRGDVEMLPLPLSEDDEDDTVFELNNHRNNELSR